MVHNGIAGNMREPSPEPQMMIKLSTAAPEMSHRLAQDVVESKRIRAEMPKIGAVIPGLEERFSVAPVCLLCSCAALARCSMIGLGGIVQNDTGYSVLDCPTTRWFECTISHVARVDTASDGVSVERRRFRGGLQGRYLSGSIIGLSVA
jgi:hypothetical protein